MTAKEVPGVSARLRPAESEVDSMQCLSFVQPAIVVAIVMREHLLEVVLHLRPPRVEQDPYLVTL